MRKFCSVFGIITMMFLLAISSKAKEQDSYTIAWSELSTGSYTLASDKGPVFLGDGAEYKFSVTGAPGNARFKWSVSPSGGIHSVVLGQTTESSSLTWQAPMSGSSYEVKVEAWVPGGEAGGDTLKGRWAESLATPFLDVYLKDGEDKHHDEVYLPVGGGATEQVFAFVGVAEAGAGLEDIKVWWEDGGSSGSPGAWSPQEQRTNAAGDASTTFTVGESAEAGDYQIVKGEIKTAPGAGGAHVTDKNAPKINVFGVEIDEEESQEIQVQRVNTSSFEWMAIPLEIKYHVFPASDWVPDKVSLIILQDATQIYTNEDLPKLSGADQIITWDGNNNQGNLVLSGEYKAKVSVEKNGCVVQSNEHSFTVYQVQVGNIVYYDIIWGLDEHAGLVYSYIGANRVEDLENDDKYLILEINKPGLTVAVSRTLKEFKEASNYEGMHCPPNLSRGNRKNILSSANALLGLPYVDSILSCILQYHGDAWEGTVSDIAKIRCDGVSEASYEDNNIRLFGANDNWNVMTDSTGLAHHNAHCTPENQRHGYLTTNSPSTLYIP